MQSLEVVLSWSDQDVPVGTLAARDHRIYFEYAPSFLPDPLPLSPFKLPMHAGVFEHANPRPCRPLQVCFLICRSIESSTFKLTTRSITSTDRQPLHFLGW